MARALCIEMESALQDYKYSSLISGLVKPVQQTLQRWFFYEHFSCVLVWRIGLSLFHAGYLPTLKSQCPYVPSVILFCELQQLPLSEDMDLLQQRIRGGWGKKFAMNLRVVGLLPWNNYTHYTVQRTLLSFAAGQSSQNSFMKEKDKVQTSSLIIHHLWLWRCQSPTVTRGPVLRLVARAAGAAEAGVVLVPAELGLQDQVAVGEMWLVHALSAQVRNVVHSSCSQAEGEAAVNTLPGLILSFCLPPKTHSSFLLSPPCQF